ncbi:MAG: hypothetical protein LBH37_03060 [Oscillospiraceae bacterium]|nr:hypothetical protein [Oscillospiraceae bacterium]
MSLNLKKNLMRVVVGILALFLLVTAVFSTRYSDLRPEGGMTSSEQDQNRRKAPVMPDGVRFKNEIRRSS